VGRGLFFNTLKIVVISKELATEKSILLLMINILLSTKFAVLPFFFCLDCFIVQLFTTTTPLSKIKQIGNFLVY